MGKRYKHHQSAKRRQAELELLFESRIELTELLELDLAVGRRMILGIEPGGRIDGPRVQGHVLPGSTFIEMIRLDGVVETEGHFLFETDDGHGIFAYTKGRFAVSADLARELADGQPFDPDMLHSYAFVTFEAAQDGPYDWLNRGFYVVRAARGPRGSEASVWQLV